MGTKNILLVLVGLGVYERSGIQYRACINISWIDRNICLDKFRKEVIGRMKQIHGGDVYRNKIKTDFSVNINPFGIPGAVENALYTAVDSCTKYPDITVEKLKKAVKDMLDVPEEYLLFGNGASEQLP